MARLFQISGCEVCGSEDLVDVLNLGTHPMCDDLVKIGDDRECAEYPIEIQYCNHCYTAHQKYQVPKAELFPASYHYRARFTTDVLNGMRGLVEEVQKRIGSLADLHVLDIGCNDGSLLNFFKEQGSITFGIEPTEAYRDAVASGHNVVNDFFAVDSAKRLLDVAKRVDVITFTNVFAHIEDLRGVIEGLKLLLNTSSVIVIENHYLGAVLDKFQFDTFYHEHPRTYSYRSFTYIARALGLDLLDVSFPARYGGNIRIIMGNKEQHHKAVLDDRYVSDSETHFLEDFRKMAEKIINWKVETTKLITAKFAESGPLKAKAFPGRAAILVKLLGLQNEIVSAVYEKPGSMKIGYYVPGTRIPIKSDTELFTTLHQEKHLLNLSWHIKDEIDAYLKANGFKGELINIISSDL